MASGLRTWIGRLPAFAAAAALMLLAATALAAPEKVTGGIRFTYKDPNAAAVALAGEFNNWSPTATPMSKDANGTWNVVVPLPAGEHQYKLVVDTQWFADPENSATAGEFGNSVVKVGADGGLVAQAATSNTAYSAKISIDGRTHGLMLDRFDPVYSRFELARPTFDIDLGFGIRISDLLRAHILTNIDPQKEDVQDYRSRLNFKRGSLDFQQPDLHILAFDSETLPVWDDPAHLVGDVGVFHDPFGYQRDGVQLTTPKLGFDTQVMYADNSAVGGTEFPGGGDSFHNFSIDRGTNRKFIFDGDAVTTSWQLLRTYRRDSVTYAFVPNQFAKLSTTDVGDGGRSFGFGDGAEDVFAASIRRSLTHAFRLGILGRADRGYHLGRFVLAQTASDTTGSILFGQSEQQRFMAGGEAMWTGAHGLTLHGEYLQGARRLDLMDRGTRFDFVAHGLNGTGATSISDTASTPLGQHFNLDQGGRAIVGGTWTFAQGDVGLSAEFERQTHRYPAWSQPPVAPAGLANNDHQLFENVDFQRSVYLDNRDLENTMVEWRLRWDRNWRYYLGRELKTSLGLEMTKFDYDPRTAWEYQLWFPTGNFWLEQSGQVVSVDRLTLLGQSRAYRLRPSLELPIRRVRNIDFHWLGDYTGIKLGLKPRYAENIFQFGLDLSSNLRLSNDTRWVKYDAPDLKLDRSYFSAFTELRYRFSPTIHVGLGWGVAPSVLNPATNEFQPIGRDVYLNQRNANGYIAENNWLSLAPQISAAENALQNERRIQFEAVVRF